MANEVNNETEESKTGETSVGEQTPEQDVAETSAPPAPEATAEPASATGRRAAEIGPQDLLRLAPTPDAPRTSPAPWLRRNPLLRNVLLQRRLRPATEEPQAMGDIDFGAILEQFEQEQTDFTPANLSKARLSACRTAAS